MMNNTILRNGRELERGALEGKGSRGNQRHVLSVYCQVTRLTMKLRHSSVRSKTENRKETEVTHDQTVP